MSRPRSNRQSLKRKKGAVRRGHPGGEKNNRGDR